MHLWSSFAFYDVRRRNGGHHRFSFGKNYVFARPSGGWGAAIFYPEVINNSGEYSSAPVYNIIASVKRVTLTMNGLPVWTVREI